MGGWEEQWEGQEAGVVALEEELDLANVLDVEIWPVLANLCFLR